MYLKLRALSQLHENRNIYKHSMLTTMIKVHACYVVKIYRKQPENIKGEVGCAGPGSAFEIFD